MVHDRINQYNTYAQEIAKRKDELQHELSMLDRQTQDLLHFLEFEKCDAIKMMKVTKKLKLIRNKRRDVKDEFSVVYQIWDRTRKSVKFTTKAGNGNYNTDIVKEFM